MIRLQTVLRTTHKVISFSSVPARHLNGFLSVRVAVHKHSSRVAAVVVVRGKSESRLAGATTADFVSIFRMAELDKPIGGILEPGYRNWHIDGP
jgi:hypothetical protein